MKSQFKDEVFAFLGPQGAFLSGSKSGYRKNNPTNIVAFNANICFVHENVEKRFFGLFKKTTYTAEKIWWGDFDLTKNWQAIKNLAQATGKTVVLLYEMDGRFENEGNPRWEKFVYKVDGNGKETLGESIKPYVMWTEDSITLIPEDTEEDIVMESGEPAPVEEQPTPEQIEEAIVVLNEAIAEVQAKAKEVKEKKPRAPRKPKADGATAAATAEKKPRAPRKPKAEGEKAPAEKKPRAPRKPKAKTDENQG
jgi:hypothetical protein